MCELKLADGISNNLPELSHPHGCVSWNVYQLGKIGLNACHTLTGVWVEISDLTLTIDGTESHPHGCVSWNCIGVPVTYENGVTSSRVCELKYKHYKIIGYLYSVTPSRVCELKSFLSDNPVNCPMVTPSRVCELKFIFIAYRFEQCSSHPHGCVSWNLSSSFPALRIPNVTPSRVCELKSWIALMRDSLEVTPSRVCELKYLHSYWQCRQHRSHPHGCVSWNLVNDLVP